MLSALPVAIRGATATHPSPCDEAPAEKRKVKQADKRDSVTALAGYDDHSSGPCVAARLEPPTRRLGGPRRRLPIWCCSA